MERSEYSQETGDIPQVSEWDALSELADKRNIENHVKSYLEKAAERNYHKNEDGEWLEEDEWGDYEPVPWFKLDVEYPELADKTEILAEKYGVKYHDSSTFKGLVYQNAEQLNAANDSYLDTLFSIRGSISTNTSGTEERLIAYDESDLKNIADSLNIYYSSADSLLPEDSKTAPRIVPGIAECFVRNYNSALVEGDSLQTMSEYAVLACTDRTNSGKIRNSIESGIIGISENEGSGTDLRAYMEYHTELLSDTKKVSKCYGTKADILRGYVRLHGVNETVLSGFQDIIFPLLEKGAPELQSILEGGNAMGMGEGTYGIADFTEECLLTKNTPSAIDKLVRIYHEIPTSDYQKFEQNRRDAINLQGTIIGGRDFIHDERIGTNEVLSAIEQYYDHHNDEQANACRTRLEKLEAKYHFGILPNAFNLEAYEQPVDKSEKETAIEILRRLVKNTAPDLMECPVTEHPRLNELMKEIEPSIDGETGKVDIDIQAVGAAVEEINALLRSSQGKQGFYPSSISAISYLDKMSAYALRNCDKKELPELAFDPAFKEIIRFSQLTSSIGYDETNFEAKYRKFTEQCGKAYGNDSIDTDISREGYRILNQWILGNMNDLARSYGSKKNTKRFSETVWSGNLSDELISMFERV